MSTVDNNAEETCLKNLGGQSAPTSATSSESSARGGVGNDEQNEKSPQLLLGPGLNTEEAISSNPSEAEEDDFPEGGLQAWLVVLGSFCAMFMVFGVVNSTGSLQEYLSTHQLRDYSSERIGWIFSLNLFLVFFLGIYSGRIFDSHNPRLLVAFGSAAMVLSLILLGFCTAYWHFILCYSVLGGTGGALLCTPAYASIGHFFKRRRGLATGTASTAGSFGGIIIPLMLQNLLPRIGFAWSVRVLGFLLLALAIPANLFLKKRLPASLDSASMLPDLTVFRNVSFALCTAGVFLMEWGLFIPIAYISSYAKDHGQDESFGFTVIALLNAGSFFGRLMPGFAADRLGRFNVIIVTISLCALTILAIWLPAGESKAVLIIFAVTFGFVSGSNLSLIPVCLSQLCKVEELGRYLSASWFVASFGTLTGLPIGGQLLITTNGDYWGLILFAGLAYIGALTCYIASRVIAVGWSPKKFF